MTDTAELTDAACKRIEVVQLLQKCKLPNEKPGSVILRALRLLATNDDWRPIETAPKNGQAILLVHDRWITVGHWHRLQNCWASSGPVYSCYPGDEQPTHWMPLPEPPA